MSYSKRPNPGQATMANSEPVVISSDQGAVPISSATLATTAKQDTGNTSVASVDTKTPALGQALAAASTPVVLTAAQVTTLTPQVNALTDTQLRATAVPVSLASTTVTGTVAVSGTVTANVGTTNGLALDATLTGGTAKSILRTAAKGTTVAADTTSTPVDANTQALDVSVKGTVPVSGTFFQATQPVSIAGTVTTTGTLTDTQLRATAVPVSGTVAVTDNAGSLTVDAPVGTPAFVRLSDGTAAIATLPVSLATLPALTASTANIGDVDVLTLPALTAGTNLIGKVGIDQTTPGTTNAVQDIPATSGGLSKFHLVSAATNVNNVKASAGQVYAITAFNLNAAARYLKLHNTSGTPTIGTGVTDTYMIPGNTAGAGLVLNIDKGIAFSTGIGLSLTTGIADADTANVAASEIVLNIYYK